MKETIIETKLENPPMSTLERLELLDVILDKTVVTAKCDGELSEVVYDRNGESYTVNKWGRKRQDYPALNQLIEALNKTPVSHAKFLAELYAKEEGKPLKLPQFISLVKAEHQDLSKIHLGIFDLLMLERNPVQADYKWKMEEVQTWLKGCSHVGVVPFLMPRTLQDVKDFWNTYVEGQGYEGLVVRQPTRTYKLKPCLEVDAVIIGLNKKTSYGKALDLFQQGQITSFKLALMDDKGYFVELSDCASGITAELRTLLWQLMDYKVSEDDRTVFIQPIAVCTIQFTDTFPKRRALLKFDGKEYRWTGWTKFVSLRHPRLIRFRPDKDVNPKDLRLTQIPEEKLPKPEESKTEKPRVEMRTLPIPVESPKEEVTNAPRIVKPPIMVSQSQSFEALKEKLYAEGWGVNSAEYMRADTPEEAIALQAKSFPCIEFQPVQLPEGKWIAFHRTPIEEYLKAQDEKEGNVTLAYLDQDDKQGKREQSESKPEMLSLNQVDWKTIFETMPEWNKDLSTPTRDKIFNLLIREGHNTKQLANFLLQNEYAKKVCEQIYPSFIILSGLSEKSKEQETHPEPVKVSFRKMFDQQPDYKVGDVVKTTHDVIGEIKAISSEPNLEGKVYDILPLPDGIESEKTEKVHQSAIIGLFEDEEEELEESEVEEPKDTSRIPIVLDITAKITKREPSPQNPDPIDLSINATAHPYVSSGSYCGAGSTHKTVEEAQNELRAWIKQQKEWFIESYHRPILVKLKTMNEITSRQTHF